MSNTNNGGGLVAQEKPVLHANAFSALAMHMNMADVEEVIHILKDSIMPKAGDADMRAFALTCTQYNLNPFVKEIYAFPTKAGGIQPMVSIDGWLKIAHNHPDFDGMEWEDGGEADDRWCECTVHLKSTPNHPVKVREYMQECKMNTEPWRMRPRRMLRHRATIQAIRYAFGVAGITDKDDFYDDYQEAPKPGSMQMRQAVVRPTGALTPAKAVLPPPVAVEAAPVVQEEPIPESVPAVADVVQPVALPRQEKSGDEPEVSEAPAPTAGAFDRLLAMAKARGKAWGDVSRVLKSCGVRVPLGASAEDFDKFAAWVMGEKPLMAELEAKLGINPDLI